MRESLEVLEHLLRRAYRAAWAVRLLHRHPEAEHQAVSGHVEDRAVVAERDLGEEREELVEERHYLARLQPLRGGSEPAQIPQEHHCVRAQVLRGEQRVAKLRVLEDLVGKPGREIAAKGAAQDFLAPA